MPSEQCNKAGSRAAGQDHDHEMLLSRGAIQHALQQMLFSHSLQCATAREMDEQKQLPFDIFHKIRKLLHPTRLLIKDQNIVLDTCGLATVLIKLAQNSTYG